MIVTLAAATLGGVVVDGGWPFFASRAAHPSREHDRLAARLRSLRLDWERIEIAQARLAAAGATSLPPDPEVAASLWQSAILVEARTSGLTEVTVTPITPQPEGELVTRVSLEIRTTGTPAQLRAFVDRVLALPPQTRIDALSLTPAKSPSDSDEDRLRLDLSVAALSLSMAEPRHELVAATSQPHTVPLPKSEFGSLLPAIDLFPLKGQATPAEPDGASPEQEARPPLAPRSPSCWPEPGSSRHGMVARPPRCGFTKLPGTSATPCDRASPSNSESPRSALCPSARVSAPSKSTGPCIPSGLVKRWETD